MSFHEPYLTPDDPDYDPLADLLGVLDLVPAQDVPDDDAGPAHPVDPGLLVDTHEEFIGRSQPQPLGRVFGGQVVAQSIIAAGRTITDADEPRHLHSLHAYFLRAGDATAPIRFHVERLRDGRSFSARRVHAVQYGKPILSMMLSFQTEAGGFDHQDSMPDVPGPEGLATVAEELADLPENLAVKKWTVRRAIDVRHVDSPLYLRPVTVQNRQSVWVRAVGELPDEPLIHAAVLAYASDYTILEACLRRNGLYWADSRLRPASLDHAMWFHRPARADDWVLYTQSSPSGQNGRGLGLGRMFAADGTMVATVAQEGMIRIKED